MSNELTGFFVHSMMMLDERQKAHAKRVPRDNRGWFSENRDQRSVELFGEVTAIKTELENIARQFGINVMEDPLTFEITEDFRKNNKDRDIEFIHLGES